MGVKSNVQGISIAPLKTALQYASDDLGIDVATASYSEICEALAEAYPRFTGTVYDNGNEIIPFSRIGYKPWTGYSTYGLFTFNSTNIYIPDIESGANKSRSIITDEMIDFTPYNTVTVIHQSGSYNFSCSDINRQAYLAFSMLTSDVGRLGYIGVITTNKGDGFAQNGVLRQADLLLSSYPNRYITKIVLS